MKDCKFCDKSGLLILPLRYAAIVGESLPADLPALPVGLGEHVADIVLTRGKYAPRMLRNGYLYTLISRSGTLYWEGYLVTEDAFLYKFPVNAPPQAPVDFTCDRNSCGINASMISIDKPEFVDKIYLIFTPTAMTLGKLKEYQGNPGERVAKGQMQEFEPSAWIKGQNNQKHTLLPALISKHVPEFILAHQMHGAKKSALGRTMAAQLYPAVYDAYSALPPLPIMALPGGRLGSIEQKMQASKAASITLFDNIGITQELNNFRNAALEPIETFLSQVDKNKVDNQRKLEVMLAIEDVKTAIVKLGVEKSRKNIEDLEALKLPDLQRDNAAMLRSLNRIPEAEAIEARIKETERRRAERKEYLLSDKHALEKWTKKYESQISMPEINNFRMALEKLTIEAEKRAELRVADHAKWITSAQLIEAFEIYDPKDMGNGFCFMFEHSLCTFGMFGTKKNMHLLKRWINVTDVKRANLYMRSNFYNLENLIAEANKTLGGIKKEVDPVSDISQVQGAPWLKLAKGLVDAFKKTDSAWDEWLRDKVVIDIQKEKIEIQPGKPSHNLTKFHRNAEGLIFARISEWTQAVSTTSGKLDKAISGIVGMLLYTRLGELAEKIGFDEYMMKIKAEKISALKAKKQQTEEFQKRADEQKQTAKSNVDKITREAELEASAKAKLDAAKVQGSIDQLIRDEQQKIRDKLKVTLAGMDAGDRPTTNNFRQARLGVLLMSIESLALVTKLSQPHYSAKIKWEISASVLSLSGMTFDLVYAVAKSIREISPYDKIIGIKDGADVIRGGLKMVAGTFSAAAGAITVALDISAAISEAEKEKHNDLLISIYIGRAGCGTLSASLGLLAAFSYSAPLLFRIAGSHLVSKSLIALRMVTAAASSAKSIAAGRTIMLIRLARFNLLGIALTVAEVGYRVFIMDDDLENWMQSCTFRLDKSDSWLNEKPFPNVETELKSLESALSAVAI